MKFEKQYTKLELAYLAKLTEGQPFVEDTINFAKEFAINFAKYLCQQEVTKNSDGGNINENYIPKEFKLLEGNLIAYPDKLLNDFIKLNYD